MAAAKFSSSVSAVTEMADLHHHLQRPAIVERKRFRSGDHNGDVGLVQVEESCDYVAECKKPRIATTYCINNGCISSNLVWELQDLEALLDRDEEEVDVKDLEKLNSFMQSFMEDINQSSKEEEVEESESLSSSASSSPPIRTPDETDLQIWKCGDDFDFEAAPVYVSDYQNVQEE